MAVLLVSSLGGSVAPIMASILNDKPSQIILVCSRDSRILIDGKPGEDLRSALESTRLSGLLASRFDDLVLDNAQDLQACVDSIHRRLTSIVRLWVQRSSEHTVLVDFTGGTKCMSAALCLVAQRWPCTFRYVGGTQRTARGVGVVISGHEIILESQNPWNALGFEAAEDAVLLCRHGSPAAAAALIDRAARRIEEPPVKRALQTLRLIAGALHQWDLFDHAKAVNSLDSAYKNFNDLHYFWSEENCALMRGSLRSCADYLRKLVGSSGPDRYQPLAIDLLGNASRRMKEERFDDAAARCYRAVEALAQARLAIAHGIPSTKHVPLDRLPAAVAATIHGNAAVDGTVMLALQQDYHLLREFDDPLGHRFFDLKLGHEDGKSPLQVRNDSIVGHGDKPLSQAAAGRLFEIALTLAGRNANDLPQFPELYQV